MVSSSFVALHQVEEEVALPEDLSAQGGPLLALFQDVSGDVRAGAFACLFCVFVSSLACICFSWHRVVACWSSFAAC